MYAIELYVPTQDNDGKDIAVDRWRALEGTLDEHFGGFTRFMGKGCWRKHAETIIVYRILREEFTDCDRETVKLLAKFVKGYWRQETVLWTLTPTAEINFN